MSENSFYLDLQMNHKIYLLSLPSSWVSPSPAKISSKAAGPQWDSLTPPPTAGEASSRLPHRTSSQKQSPRDHLFPLPLPQSPKVHSIHLCLFCCLAIQGHHYHLSKFHIYVSVYCIGDPAIPLLGVHTEETRIERDTCTPMFITALFIIARTWKQPLTFN